MKLQHTKHRLRFHQGSKPFGENRDLPTSLIDIKPGQIGIVTHLRGGREFTNRLAGMGFSLGAQVTVISNRGHGSIVVSILGSNFALGRQEAIRIEVTTA